MYDAHFDRAKKTAGIFFSGRFVRSYVVRRFESDSLAACSTAVSLSALLLETSRRRHPGCPGKIEWLRIFAETLEYVKFLCASTTARTARPARYCWDSGLFMDAWKLKLVSFPESAFAPTDTGAGAVVARPTSRIVFVFPNNSQKKDARTHASFFFRRSS